MLTLRFGAIFIIAWFIGITQTKGQSIQKTLYKLPDTGLQTSFTNTFGEDDDYRINIPNYSNIFPGIVFDSITLLMWQKSDGGEMSIESARKYCDTLTLGGFTDWRLPTALEAYSLVFVQKTPPALNLNYFSNTGGEYWWTSETQHNDTNKIWVTNAGGGIGNHSKSETVSAGGTKKFHVRAVRNTFAQTIYQRYTVMQNCIFDSITSLLWIQLPDTASKTWEEALTYCQNLSIGSLSDWRLPNLKEMQSIVDLSTSNPAIRASFFPIASSSHYWTSTSMPNQTDKAWYFDSKFGITTYALKTAKKRCWATCSPSPTAYTEYLTTFHSFQILPNPNLGTFSIQTSKWMLNLADNNKDELADSWHLRILNPLGDCLVTISLTQLTEVVSLPHIPKGIYLVELSREGMRHPLYQWMVLENY